MSKIDSMNTTSTTETPALRRVSSFVMPSLELFIFGLTAALMGGSAPSSPTFAPPERQSTDSSLASDPLFLAHRPSFFNDQPSSSSKGHARRVSEAFPINRSFDDQVEDLMDNPW